MNPLYPALAEHAGERCEYCRAPEQVFNFAFEVEHILPRAVGGGDASDNLALACESCNLYKSDAVTGYNAVEARDIALFHPRRNRWEDHFQFDAETGEVRGLTPTGRGTAARLRFNSPFQLRARRQWARLGLYP